MFASLKPDTFRIQTHFQVMELYVSLEVKGDQGKNIKKITNKRYLVMLNQKKKKRSKYTSI